MRHLVSAGLPYINGVKHLGNLVGSMLPADVYARFLRREGHEVLYICATDEHGAPAELAAEAKGQDVASFCAEQHEIQRSIYEGFALSFDHFGRSSSIANRELTQELAKQLYDAGYLEARPLKQLYCIDDERYLADRYVIGTCPHCGYEAARGDQCENCTRLLDATELLNPRSAVSGSERLEVRESRHLFLLLSKLQPTIEAWVEARASKWPELSRSTARKWLNEGLRDRCITRDLKWGVPVPYEGFEDKVFYVWFDAPIEYIGATREWAEAMGTPDAWESWWRGANDDVQYTQFMGKDNLPFHTIMFPGMLLGTGHPWKTVDQVKGFSWLNYYGSKFSTSLQHGVFTDAALECFPADYWRYALMAQIPESMDASFTWETFAQAVNKDLADVLGNFANRVLRLCNSKFGDAVPEGAPAGPAEVELQRQVTEHLQAYVDALQGLRFREAMKKLRALWTLGNVYLNEEKPWTRLKEGKRDEAGRSLRTCINLIKTCAIAAEPVIPSLSKALLDALGLSESQRSGPLMSHAHLNSLVPGHAFTVIEPLISRVEPEQIAELEARFGGAS